MKKYILFSIVILNCIYAHSQLDINSTFSSTHTGRNVSLTLSKTFKQKHEFGVGLCYNINRLMHTDDQMNVFKKRLYATKLIHYLGLHGFYQRNICSKWQIIKPCLLFDLQIKNSTLRSRHLSPFATENNGDPLYKEFITYLGPFTWIEQNIGIGFKANLYKNLYLTNKMGAGVCFILGKEQMILKRRFTWEFGGLLQTGLVYRIKD